MQTTHPDVPPHTEPVRDTASVTVSTPVDGTRYRRRRRVQTRKDRPTMSMGTTLTVHPEVMAKVHEVRRPGEKVVIVSATEVRLVPAD